eukprot:8824968-Lingulodinium_polyedra.AAC.1
MMRSRQQTGDLLFTPAFQYAAWASLYRDGEPWIDRKLDQAVTAPCGSGCRNIRGRVGRRPGEAGASRVAEWAA